MSMMRFFNEYLFHQIVEQVNETRKEQGLSVITTTQARALRRQFGNELKERNLAKTPPNDFIAATNELFSEYANGDVLSMEDYQVYVSQFRLYTGVGGRAAYGSEVIPMSPYDPRFAGRGVFLKNGSSLLFTDKSVFFDEQNKMRSTNDIDASSASVYQMRNERFYTLRDQLLSRDDMSGISALMPYMIEAEYRVASDWVGRVGDNDPDRYMTLAAVERSRALLEMMRQEGISYTIEPDARIGQLQAKIDGTKISVRLMDSRDHEMFAAGRVYNDGQVIRYTTNKKAVGGTRTVSYTPQNAEESMALLKYAMGQSVKRWDKDESVGVPGRYLRTFSRTRDGVRQQSTVGMNEAYHSGSNFSARIGPYPKDPNASVFIHVENGRDSNGMYFRDETVAEEYLRAAVDTARANFEDAVGLERLIKEAEEHGSDPDYQPAFSGNIGIAAIQQSYWDILIGNEDDVLRPGADVDAYKEALGSVVSEDSVYVSSSLVDVYRYQGTPTDKVRQHMADNVNYLIGHYDKDRDGKRFDPVNVASFMTSQHSMPGNNDNIIRALRMVNVPAAELKGSDFYNKTIQDRLIKFNPDMARPMYLTRSPFMQDMYQVILTTLRETGCEVDEKDILMDDNGIVHYHAARAMGERSNPKKDVSSREEFEGEIGQLFEPDGMGLVETKFAGSDNYLFVPGYEATVVSGPAYEGVSFEDRIRLRGYQQMMRENLAYTLRGDLMRTDAVVGTPTSVNNTYRRLYDTRHALDWPETSLQEGMDDKLRQDIIKTESLRVHFPKLFRDEATINAEARYRMMGDDVDIANDNFYDVYRMTGYRNMSVRTKESAGYFGAEETGSGTNQGYIVCYLTEGAEVTPEGKIIPSEDKDDKTPLMKNEICQYMKYTPSDRQVMTFLNLMKASCVTEPTKTAQMTLGGWTFDDGYVVSRRFADSYRIRGTDGQMRSLIIGDKISDMNGNKGVISLVVDPDMPAEEAKEKGIDSVVRIFHDNPELDVVGAPFAAASRFNGGSARELMKDVSDLNLHGEVKEGCIGTARYIITHMAVDEKTHVYGQDELAQGKGRKASSQLAWALCSQNATHVLHECYGSNNSAASNLREVLIGFGMDMSETGDLRDHYEAHEGESRKVFEMPELRYTKRNTRSGEKEILDVVGMKREFGDIIAQQGGFLEMPFPLEFPNGRSFDKLTEDEHVTVNYQALEWTRKGYTRKDGVEVKPTTVHRHEDANRERQGLVHQATYAMPVISSHLRSEQMFEDGTSHMHDYTGNYLGIYEASLRYRDAQAHGDEDSMAKYRQQAQAEYDKIVTGMQKRYLESKKNIFRDGLMSNRMPHSATAVWTADPRLDIDQVAVSEAIAESMNLQDDDYVLTLRDPVLRDAGVKYMRVKVSDELTGVAINPVMDKGYDGDFDGDSIGLIKLTTKEARREAMEKLTVWANLLDKGSRDENGLHPLMLQDSLDLKSAAYESPYLVDKRERLTGAANEIDADPNMSPEERTKAQKAVMKELDEYVHEAFDSEYGHDIVCFANLPSLFASYQHMIDNGSKGSVGKLRDYAKYLGVTIDTQVDENGEERLDLSSIKDCGGPLVTDEDREAVQFATAVKAFGTGVAGRFSQRGMEAFRNSCPKAVLELTYPVTQAILQSKHDPVEARHKYEMLMGPGRDLWRGYKLQKKEVNAPEGVQATWQKVRDKNGKPVQATRDEFVSQFVDMYTSKDGLNVAINPDYVEVVADELASRGVNGKVANIEETHEGKAFMDIMAYDGSFEYLMQAAKDGVNVYDGVYNQHFAPSQIYRNMQAEAEGGVKRAIKKSDVTADYKPAYKGEPKVTTVSSGVKSASGRMVSDMSDDEKYWTNVPDMVSVDVRSGDIGEE